MYFDSTAAVLPTKIRPTGDADLRGREVGAEKKLGLRLIGAYRPQSSFPPYSATLQTTYPFPSCLDTLCFLPLFSQCICGRPLFRSVCWLQLPCPLQLHQLGALLMPPWQFNLRALGSMADSRNSKNQLELFPKWLELEMELIYN